MCFESLHLCSRFVTKLLEDLVFFVCVVPNNGQDVLSVVTATPNRERQKLMREQNILAQVSKSAHTVTLTHFCLPSYDLHGVTEGYYHRQCPLNELLIMSAMAYMLMLIMQFFFLVLSKCVLQELSVYFLILTAAMLRWRSLCPTTGEQLRCFDFPFAHHYAKQISLKNIKCRN